jgi:DNA-directed RNA polymerase subunit RPC12/RpoP
MGKRLYKCGTCSTISGATELRRNKHGDICCPNCGSEDISRHLSTLQKFCSYLLVSNFY